MDVFVFSTLTTVLLQVLSNMANDYGDYKKGTDALNRVGPERMVTSGKISAKKMKIAIIINIILVLISGSFLIFTSLEKQKILLKLFFYLLGIMAITSAIKYTMGKKPYGYYGFGDFMVFIFFGILGVLGTYYLHTHELKYELLLPATSIGLLSVGVLNLNNLRDYRNDKKALKRTMVVILGNRRAKIYHITLISGAFLATFIYSVLHFKSAYQFLFLLALPLFVQDIKNVIQNTHPSELNRELKHLALSTLLFSITVGIGVIIS